MLSPQLDALSGPIPVGKERRLGGSFACVLRGWDELVTQRSEPRSTSMRSRVALLIVGGERRFARGRPLSP